jgi:hypothetical protein
MGEAYPRSGRVATGESVIPYRAIDKTRYGCFGGRAVPDGGPGRIRKSHPSSQHLVGRSPNDKRTATDYSTSAASTDTSTR